MSDYMPTTDTVQATYVVHHSKCEPCGDEREALVAEFDRWFVAQSPELVAELVAEVERLRRWKVEASEALIGLQDLGKALGILPGQRITGEGAAEAARVIVTESGQLRAAVERVRAEANAYADQPEVLEPCESATSPPNLPILAKARS